MIVPIPLLKLFSLLNDSNNESILFNYLILSLSQYFHNNNKDKSPELYQLVESWNDQWSSGFNSKHSGHPLVKKLKPQLQFHILLIKPNQYLELYSDSEKLEKLMTEQETQRTFDEAELAYRNNLLSQLSETERERVINEHTLRCAINDKLKLVESRSYTCNLCSSRFIKTHSFVCDVCDFDACIDCVFPTEKEKIKQESKSQQLVQYEKYTEAENCKYSVYQYNRFTKINPSQLLFQQLNFHDVLRWISSECKLNIHNDENSAGMKMYQTNSVLLSRLVRSAELIIHYCGYYPTTVKRLVEDEKEWSFLTNVTVEYPHDLKSKLIVENIMKSFKTSCTTPFKFDEIIIANLSDSVDRLELMLNKFIQIIYQPSQYIYPIQTKLEVEQKIINNPHKNIIVGVRSNKNYKFEGVLLQSNLTLLSNLFNKYNESCKLNSQNLQANVEFYYVDNIDHRADSLFTKYGIHNGRSRKTDIGGVYFLPCRTNTNTTVGTTPIAATSSLTAIKYQYDSPEIPAQSIRYRDYDTKHNQSFTLTALLQCIAKFYSPNTPLFNLNELLTLVQPYQLHSELIVQALTLITSFQILEYSQSDSVYENLMKNYPLCKPSLTILEKELVTELLLQYKDIGAITINITKAEAFLHLLNRLKLIQNY